jgi:TIR domain
MIRCTGFPICVSDFREVVLASIFINYRRNDSEGEAGRLFDDLERGFGEQSVFMDVAGIGAGQDFRKAIDQSVAACSVLLALIGQQWLESRDEFGARRLDCPGDFVRIELAAALRGKTPVVPVLVRGSSMPRASQLPDDLKDLAYHNAVELTHARWKSDVQLLIRSLRPYMEASTAVDARFTGVSKQPKPEASPVRHDTAGRRIGAASISSSISPQAVDRLSRELASYLGPIANVIVKRAVPRCNSVEELCAIVAREIDSETDRIRFLGSNRA